VSTPPRAPLALTIERLTFGFDALARHDGHVVFVPYAAPGDRVLAEPIGRGKGFLRARLLAVETPGAARVTPPCPVFGACGGCQWQHVGLEAQRDAKRAIVVDQLVRIAGLASADAEARVAPTRGTGDGWAYRGRITLAVEGRTLGYRAARSHRLVPIDACPIAAPAIDAALPAARALVEALRMPLTRLGLSATPGGVALVAVGPRPPGAADEDACAALLARLPALRGVVLRGGGQRRVVGDPHLRVELERGLHLEVPADAFTQVHPAANRLLVETVCAFADVRPGTTVVDLYCGAGNLTLPLARRGAAVVGVERDDVAIAAARANATRLGLGNARFETLPVARALATLGGQTPELVVLDPPRAGVGHDVTRLAAWRARRLVYVSCDPATLARDAGALVAAGYTLARVQPFDVFPQTYHVECVAEFLLT